MQIEYHNRHRLSGALENMLSARFQPDLDQLVAQADVISLHCPATPETHHVLDARRIAAMKPSAYVVNTARGQLIEGEALIAALEAGRIGGAGLDVYHSEPFLDPGALPHLGSATFGGREASGDRVIANTRFWADGHRPPDQVLDGLV